jgi:hypothetical protein
MTMPAKSGQAMHMGNDKSSTQANPNGGDHSEGISPSDEALLHAIATSSRSGGRHRALTKTGADEASKDATGVLTATEEELLRKAVENRASDVEMSQVSKLLHGNSEAREYLLAHRLTWAAQQGPAVPEALTKSVLRLGNEARRPIEPSWWSRMVRLWQWRASALAGLAAVAVLLMVFPGRDLFLPPSKEKGMRFAQVTLADRSLVASDAGTVVRSGGEAGANTSGASGSTLTLGALG